MDRLANGESIGEHPYGESIAYLIVAKIHFYLFYREKLVFREASASKLGVW